MEFARRSRPGNNHIKYSKKVQPYGETLIVGDSYIGIFKLLKPSSNVQVLKIKGGTAKGLSRNGSESNTQLAELLEKHEYVCGIFNFGQVDLYLSFYYDLLIKKQTNDFEYYDTLAKNYVHYIANLKNINKKIVMAVYPLPATPDKISKVVVNYGIVQTSAFEGFPTDVWDDLVSTEKSRSRFNRFNEALERECVYHEIEFASINDRILDEDDNIKSTFKDANEFNIHLLWEPIIDIWVDYFNNYGICRDNLSDIEASAGEYLKHKHDEMQAWKDGKHATVKQSGQDGRKYNSPDSASNNNSSIRNNNNNNNNNNSSSSSSCNNEWRRGSQSNNATNEASSSLSSAFNPKTSSSSRSYQTALSMKSTALRPAVQSPSSKSSALPATGKYIPPHLRPKV